MSDNPKCETCRWFIAYKEGDEGVCRRYPESVQKFKTDFCGEHSALHEREFNVLTSEDFKLDKLQSPPTWAAQSEAIGKLVADKTMNPDGTFSEKS